MHAEPSIRDRDPTIRTAHIADLNRLTAILAESFLHGDLAYWLIADVADRRRVYPRYFRILAEHALHVGLVDVISHHAAAVWYPVVDGPVPPVRDYERRLSLACGGYTSRFQALDAAVDAHHPISVAHHYLAFLAVVPEHLGRGHGSALLRHHHAEADEARLPTYLEATGLRNRNLYARHGYRPVATFHVRNGPVLHPMWRRPRPTSGPPAEPTSST